MKKPLSFGATMLASALGVVIVSVVAGIIMFVTTIAMVVAVGSAGSKQAVAVQKGTFLSVDLGSISGDRTQSALGMSLSGSSSVGLVDAVEAIRAAASDSRVAGILLSDPGSATLSWGSLKELRDALAGFAQQGKPVVAYATGYSQGGYYVASAASSICLHPSGMVDFRGFASQVMYYKDLLDKLGVEMQLIRPESCSYKSAGEVYTLNRMSAANREQIRTYIGSNWQTVLGEIAASRGLAAASLNRMADDLSAYLASDALGQRLVDTLCFEADMRQMLKDRYEGKRLLSIGKYADNVRLTAEKNGRGKDAIAVVYAEGNVVDGSSRGFDRAVYGDDIVKALRQATDNDKVKAIVLRVNSPGGAATASESMTHAVMQAREKKPVVVSMGDLAASAGYEMSCMAHVIVAQPTTLTGSIGVFGTVPNVGKMMRSKLGLNVDTVSTNRNAAGLTVMSPLSADALRMMNRNVEDFYKVFVGRVAEGRHRTFDEIHQVARGRVWTGRDALGIGLVDTLGGLDLAIRIAAERAGVDDYRVAEYPEEKDTWTMLSELLSDGDSNDNISLLARVRTAWQYRLMKRGGLLPKPLSRLEEDVRYLGTAEGVQARMPFVVIDE